MAADVFWSPCTSGFENRACGTIVTGSPGAGKSFFLLNILANAIESGQRIFGLDAKEDLLPLTRVYPFVKRTDVNNITPGSLDPFLVFPKLDAPTLLTITELIVGGMTDEQRLAITPIISDFLKETNTTFRKFADYLFQNPKKEAQVIGNALHLNKNTKYGKLIFGDMGRKVSGLRFGSNESNIISILGMKLPDGKSKTKTDENLNAAVVYIICKMLKDMLTEKRSKVPVVIAFDECHILMRSNAIMEIIDDFLVLGRSLGVSVIMGTQNVSHFPRDFSNLVASKFIFKMSKDEVQEFFDLFDNSSSINTIDRIDTGNIITRLNTGYCYFADSHGNSAFIHIKSNLGSGEGGITSNPLLKKEEKALNLGTK